MRTTIGMGRTRTRPRLAAPLAVLLAVIIALTGSTPAPASARYAPPSVPPPNTLAALTSPPTLQSPANGATLGSLAINLAWTLPAGATQEQVQVIPANNDGPGVNLIQNASGQLAVPPPPTWYVVLPGMGYPWRVRATDTAEFAGESDPAWGPWSEVRSFRTPNTSSDGMLPVSPADKAPLFAAGPVTVQWSHPSPSIFYFEIQVSGDQRFDTNPATATSFVWWNLIHGGVTTPPNAWTTPPVEPNLPYYWRVRPRVQGDGTPVGWSPTFCFGTNCQAAPAATVLAPAQQYGVAPSGDLSTVASVLDGDTLSIWVLGKLETVRIIGIDAPALPSGSQGGQCFGREAATRASELLEGQRVYLAGDTAQGARDASGRMWAYVWLQDIRNVGELLLREGYARESGHGKPYGYQPPYQGAQNAATAGGKGLWSAATCGGR